MKFILKFILDSLHGFCTDCSIVQIKYSVLSAVCQICFGGLFQNRIIFAQTLFRFAQTIAQIIIQAIRNVFADNQHRIFLHPNYLRASLCSVLSY